MGNTFLGNASGFDPNDTTIITDNDLIHKSYTREDISDACIVEAAYFLARKQDKQRVGALYDKCVVYLKNNHKTNWNKRWRLLFQASNKWFIIFYHFFLKTFLFFFFTVGMECFWSRIFSACADFSANYN